MNNTNGDIDISLKNSNLNFQPSSNDKAES